MIGNVRPKKYLGQHFLIDENISQKIIDSVDFTKYDKVIEVGPGKGALTKYLLYLKDVLTLIEIDKESILFLENEFKNETNDGVLHPSCVRGITAVSKETRSGREDVRSNL